MPLAPIDDAIAAMRDDRMIVLVDDEGRENEGDLVMAAGAVDEKAIAFMAKEGRGLICLAMAGEMVDRLGLPMMTARNRSRMGTAFTVSIEAASGVTTGISAADRARTVQVAISPQARPTDVVTPGHVFPLRAVEGGVLVRAGQTEGSVDLARLAGLTPAAVICEIMKDDGTMARRDDLEVFCAQHGLILAAVADLIAWREARESLVERIVDTAVDTQAGPARACVYRCRIGGQQHLALVFGDALTNGRPPLVRVQRQAVLADVFGIGAAPFLPGCLRRLTAEGGVMLYLCETPGGDLATALSRHGQATDDPRAYGIGAQILRDLGIRRMRLITASDRHPHALSGHGLEIVGHVTPCALA